MKGQQQALSALLITGVLIAVVGSVYFWGLPLIQKNKDVSSLENSEGFMLNLNNKIKGVVNYGGVENIDITVPGVLEFDSDNITLTVETTGSLYAAGAWIPLSKNSCSLTSGTWGLNTPEVLCVRSECISSGGICEKYQTEYKLNYIRLDTQGVKSYKIDLIGNRVYGGEDNYIRIENKGTTDVGNLIKMEIEISIL